MPEFTAIHIILLAVMVIVGIAMGWKLRGGRARQEKAAINAGWQEQIEAQRSEHERLTHQNKGLMEQIGQYQASNKDAKNRAKELAEAIQEAYGRRDELQREIKDVRSNLDVVTTQRDRLQSDLRLQANDSGDSDAEIQKLKDALKSWQDRVPPLMTRYRERDAEADELAVELRVARERIAELETLAESSQTHIEPVSDPDALTNGRDASNDSLQETNRFLSESELSTAGDETAQDDSLYDELPDELPDNLPNDLSGDARDELQKIKGIGPAIEKTLNEMGIFKFHQIANMSEYDIDRVAIRLKGFHSRIYREDWIGQARDLRDQFSNG